MKFLKNLTIDEILNELFSFSGYENKIKFNKRGQNKNLAHLKDAKIKEVLVNCHSSFLCLVLNDEDGTVIRFSHKQQCCETVDLLDVDNDDFKELRELKGSRFKELTFFSTNDVKDVSEDDEKIFKEHDCWFENSCSCYEYSFYDILTSTDKVQLRFYGTSNGYYSIDVDVSFYKMSDLNEALRLNYEEYLDETEDAEEIQRFEQKYLH